MARPKPTIILESINKTSYKSDQVLLSDGVWAVFHDGKPINLKTSNILVAYPGPKYRNPAYLNPGHAINLCKKLNAQFKTDRFTVVLMTAGATVYP